MKTRRFCFFVCVLLSVLCLAGAVSAQVPGRITGMTLDTDMVLLEAGDTYEFTPVFTTEDGTGFADSILNLYSTDENVVKVGENLNTIEAIGGGEAKVFVYSHGYEASAVVTVKVSGEAKSVAAKGGKWENPPADQLTKLSDPALKAFYELLAQPEMAGTAAALAQSKTFTTLVSVTAGRAESLAGAMEKLGMELARPIPSINTIMVRGTAEQYLYLLKSENILSIYENETLYAHADTMLSGQSEALSNFDALHYTAGLTGKDKAIVILDTGIDPNHEQFTGKTEGKVLKFQACFSTPQDLAWDRSACKTGYEDLSSAEIGPSVTKPSEFYHGTQVAAIAAGKDGVAPEASIIPISVFYEHEYVVDATHYITRQASMGDVYSALDYVYSMIASDGTYTEDGVDYQVAAINMSFGEGKYGSACKKVEPGIVELFEYFLEEGVPIVVSAGDDAYDRLVGWPACSPTTFVVGALWDSAEPEVASFSDHANIVDILAPGTQIYSATHGTNNYDFLNGSSAAAPMVSGAIATVWEAFPNMSYKQVEAVLTAMSTKTAVRGGIKKPVLDFTALPDFIDLMDNGTITGVYGGNKFLQVEFATLPFNVKYSLEIYKGIGISGDPVAKLSKKNLTTAKISKLTNDQPYTIRTEAVASIAGEDYVLPTLISYGMPMEALKGVTLVQVPGSSDAQLSWTPEPGASLDVLYSVGDGPEYPANLTGATFTIPATYSVPVYATAWKHVVVDSKDYLSLPVSLQTAVVTNPTVDVLAGPSNVRISYYTDDFEGMFLKQRQIQIWTADSVGMPLKKVKSLNVDINKNPRSVVVTGLKNDVDYVALVRNVMKVGSKTYTLDWDDAAKSAVFTPKASQAFNEGYLDFMMGNGISGVSIAVGSKSARVSYSEDNDFFIADGYRFEVKPVSPNSKRTIIEVPVKKAQGGYTITGLTNGWVYKMRMMLYELNGKNKAYSMAFPEYSTYPEDTAWPGLLFVPLAEPTARVSYDTMTNELSVIGTRDEAADGFTAVFLGGMDSSSTTADVQSQKWLGAGSETEMVPYVGDVRLVIVMLFKDYEEDGTTTRFYGPAVYFGDPMEIAYNEGYGGKAADEFNWKALPEFADAPQVDGIPNLVAMGLSAKALTDEAVAEETVTAEPAAEAIEFEVETYDEIVDENTADEEAADDVASDEAVEVPAEAEAEEEAEAEDAASAETETDDVVICEYEEAEFDALFAEEDGDPEVVIEEPEEGALDQILIFEAEDDDPALDTSDIEPVVIETEEAAEAIEAAEDADAAEEVPAIIEWQAIG